MDRWRTLPDVVRRLGARLMALHLSDYDGVDEKHDMPGRGVLHWKSFMQTLRDVEYDGPFNYETRPDGETAAAQIESLEEGGLPGGDKRVPRVPGGGDRPGGALHRHSHECGAGSA